MMQRERCLDQAGDACGCVEVADVGLQRAECAVTRLLRHRAERLRETGDLDRVAESRAGSMSLDVADRVGVDAGERLRHGDRLRLAVHARRGEARPCRSHRCSQPRL